MNFYTYSIFYTLTSLFTIAETCSCQLEPLSQHDTWCGADWVSVVKILSKTKEETTSWLSIGPRKFPQIKYTVEHMQIFKGNKTLSNEIFTGLDDASCGVSWLRENHSYLLVGSKMFCFRDGSKHDGVLTINYCFGMPLRDGAYGTITEWENVPENFQNKLFEEDFKKC